MWIPHHPQKFDRSNSGLNGVRDIGIEMTRTSTPSTSPYVTVASRVKRFPRSAAVKARQQMSDMAADAFEFDEYQHSGSMHFMRQVSPANHTYVLRSMRR